MSFLRRYDWAAKTALGALAGALLVQLLNYRRITAAGMLRAVTIAVVVVVLLGAYRWLRRRRGRFSSGDTAERPRGRPG